MEDGTDPTATIEAMNAFGYGSANPDPRLELTYYTGKVIVNGEEVINSDTGEPLEYKPMAVKLQFDKGDTNVWTAGARMYKYADDATATEDGQCPHNDWVLFRYSDVVLMRAEALVRNGQRRAKLTWMKYVTASVHLLQKLLLIIC